jgi:uncharacterized protein Usg
LIHGLRRTLSIADRGPQAAVGVIKLRGSALAQLNLMLKGYRLTTAEILYLAPKYPVLSKFLKFWEGNLEGRLHSVRVASCGILCPLDVRHVGHEISIH